MKYYIIAGEASGDLHGSNLMKAIKKIDLACEFRFWGGDLMQQQGGTLVKHYRDLAFMGFAEVVMNLQTIFKNLYFCKQDILGFQPEVIIFIDYPGFNMRIAKWAKQQNFKTHYYIAPQVWAWKENRVKDIKKYIDKLYVILPFEKTFFEDKHQYPVEYVGHPLLDAIGNYAYQAKETFYTINQLDSQIPIIALLPGSRKQEIKAMLPLMLSVQNNFSTYQFVVAGAPSLEASFYEELTKNFNCKIVFGQTYDLLNHATAALVTSGTATLETALHGVPEVVCYKGNAISYFIAKRIITLKYISLVNLIMDQAIVKELIQEELNNQNLEVALNDILQTENQKIIKTNYQNLVKKLGGQGASDRTAKKMLDFLRK